MGKVAVYPRFVERRIRDALIDTRVVLLVGPRQSGKTTLAQKLAGKDMVFLTLDNATTLDAASTDPVGFVRGLDRAVIDEIQRAPDLLLAIKESVDNDPRPGRFLLTGSSNLMTLPRVADSLAGRMETVRLLPLAQSEILGNQPSFFRDVFSDRTPAVSEAIVGDDLIELALGGGYPDGAGNRCNVQQHCAGTSRLGDRTNDLRSGQSKANFSRVTLLVERSSVTSPIEVRPRIGWTAEIKPKSKVGIDFKAALKRS